MGSALREIATGHPASSQLDVEAPVNLVVETDEELLRSIVGNLLDNAAKYSPEGSRIHLVLTARSHVGSEGVELSVLNEVGDAGVPDVEKLFTKYYRSKGAHRRPGSGLGLFLVASWTKNLGGKISYELIDQGDDNSLVCFSLWLPK